MLRAAVAVILVAGAKKFSALSCVATGSDAGDASAASVVVRGDNKLEEGAMLTAGVWAVYSSGSEYSRNLRQQRRSEERGVFRVLRAGETTESRRRASAAPGTEVK